jgi:hypothetical protein
MIALRALLAMVILLLPGVHATAAEKPTIQLYRYVDSRGITVLDTQGVPPEYVGKGYQILNQQGRVIQTVPPAPTAEENRQAAARQAQAQADAQLLHLYPSLPDLDRGHAQEQAELDTRISVANNSLQSLQLQQNSLQAQAASQERAAQPVQAMILKQLASIKDERAMLNAQLAKYQQRKNDVNKAYAANRARMVELLGTGK